MKNMLKRLILLLVIGGAAYLLWGQRYRIAQLSNKPPAPRKYANAVSRSNPNIRLPTVSKAICLNPFIICEQLYQHSVFSSIA